MAIKVLSSVLFAMLLCVLYVAQAETHDTMRLCGRAFVRALVYTCGGSRWRRLTVEDNTLPEGEDSLLSSELWSQHSDVLEAIDRQQRDQNQALMTECCQFGCRRTDLSTLC
uniref:Insulin-like domain-containing protein n=1 Tax=Sphaeramia orbicularis TaxID=375764 RepID=A0A673AMD9_9TELE